MALNVVASMTRPAYAAASKANRLEPRRSLGRLLLVEVHLLLPSRVEERFAGRTTNQLAEHRET